MRVVFFGNTKYSVIVAKTINTEYGLSSIVTIPDRPLGRKKTLTPSPVKQFAVEENVPFVEFDKLVQLAIDQLARLKPDFFVVADYGLILPKEILDLPKFAPLNVHHSLLPKYRGPSPAPTAILNGDKISGVTVIKMTDEVDAGPILTQKEYELKPDETTDSLLTTLNTIGGGLVVDVIKNYQSIKPIPQDESKASMTKRMTKQQGFVDLANPPSPEQLDRTIRAYYPWPTVWAILRTKNQELRTKFLPGQKLQVEGGKPMSVKDFINGYPEMKGIIQKLGNF